MKILVALQVCHAYSKNNQVWWEQVKKHDSNCVNEQIQACRGTWLKDLKVDYRFFYGMATRQPLEDEVFLDVPDDYKSLPHKLKSIYKWAVEHEYDYIFKGDDDTYVYVDRLMRSDFEGKDYLGFSWNNDRPSERYAAGLGYWVSAKAAEIISKANVDDIADDRWAGKILYNNGIILQHDARYHHIMSNQADDVNALLLDHEFIAIHPCNSKMMKYLHGDLTKEEAFPKVFVRDEVDEIMDSLHV